MGLCSRRSLLCGAILVAVLAYTSYTPLPDVMEYRAIRTVAITMYRLLLSFARCGEYLGFGSYIVTVRKVTRSAVAMATRLQPDNSNVEVTADNMADVDVLIFRPKPDTTDMRPGLIFLHGGGWTMLDPDTYRQLCSMVTMETQAVVVSVDYRLAPEHVFPAAIEDCIKVTKYFLRNAHKYGVNAEKIGISGDSSGGNLAMATALHLGKEKTADTPALKMQWLLYPSMQAFDFNLPSYATYKDGPGILRKRMMVDFVLSYLFGDTTLLEAFASNNHTSSSLKKSKYASYVSAKLLPENLQKELTSPQSCDYGNETLSKEVERLILDPQFSPLMASDEDLSVLPATYLVIAECDVLRDDGFLTAARLRNVQVQVTVRYKESEDHAFMAFVHLKSTREEIAHFARYYKKILSEY